MTLKRTLSSEAHFFLKFDFDSADFAILPTDFYQLLPQQSQKVRWVELMCGGANMIVKVSELRQEETICLEKLFIRCLALRWKLSQFMTVQRYICFAPCPEDPERASA